MIIKHLNKLCMYKKIIYINQYHFMLPLLNGEDLFSKILLINTEES